MQLTFVVECVGTDRGNGPFGCRSGNTAVRPARFEANEGVKRRWIALALLFRPAHSWMMASSASTIGVIGSCSDGLRTNVLPHTIAIGNIQSGIIAGKLNGVMPAHTPSGWRMQ